MDDQKTDDEMTADDGRVSIDKTADGELSDDELTDATGGRKSYAKKPNEDAGTDDRAGLP